MRECPKNKQGSGNEGNKAQSSSVAPPDTAEPRGSIYGTRKGTNYLYALNNRQEHGNSPDVITGMIQVFDFIIYALLHPGKSLYFVTPNVAMNFDIIPEQLSQPFSVSTPVGASILAKRVYRDCLIPIDPQNTTADLVVLDMIDFDIVLNMDQLHAYYV